MHLSDVHTFLCRVVLYDQLLQKQECPFVVNSLSELNLCDPQVRSVGLLTVNALLISNNVFDNEALLQQSTIEDLLLDGQLDLDSLGVRLGPYKACIHKLDAL